MSTAPRPAPTTAIDPICGMTVAAVDTSLHTDHDGQRWYFCGPGCLRAFSSAHMPDTALTNTALTDTVAGYAAS